MIYGISGDPLDTTGTLRYAVPIQRACEDMNFPPKVAYAVAWRESIGGEVHGEWPDAATVLSSDGGHGLFQLTSSWPDDWYASKSNALYALRVFLWPALKVMLHELHLTGDDLVRATAAAFNAGIGGALAGHYKVGDVDAYTTDRYGENVLRIYRDLVISGSPQ